MAHAEHHKQTHQEDVRCAVITVSDTRSEATDRSGSLMQDRLQAADCAVVHYAIVEDDPEKIVNLLDTLTSKDVDAVLFNGGTGISARDRTYEALAGQLEKTLPGFGELFRMLSYEEIGSGAMLSRAVAGVYRHMLVFSTPGSPGAVKLAMDKLIVPELRHLVWEVRRQKEAGD